VLQSFKTYNFYSLLVRNGLALLVAFNYFAFRVELFEDEYEDQHPAIDPFKHECTLSLPTINWETFDKDNAPKAITVLPFLSLTLLLTIPGYPLPAPVQAETQQIIRDKSPPL